MSALRFVLSYLFFFLLFLKMITSQDCSCNNTGPPIFFPFSVKNVQGRRCGVVIPGYNRITCDSNYRTVFNLPPPFEESFLVRSIDYYSKVITLVDDYNNCTWDRFRNIHFPLDLDLLPFRRTSLRLDKSYDVFHCLPSVFNNTIFTENFFKFIHVPCAANTWAIADASGIGSLDGNCVNESVVLPVGYDFKTDELHLTWNEPKETPEPGKGNSRSETCITGVVSVAAVIVLAAVLF